MTDRGAPGTRVGDPVGFALDIQALQDAGRPRAEWPGWPGWPPGSTSLRHIQAHVAAWAAALARTGRLRAALLAPEYPAPDPESLPAPIRDSELLRWDSRAEVRRLTGRYRRIVHHVPAPFLDTDVGDPAGRVAGSDWADAGAPRVVTVFDLDPLEEPDRWLTSTGRRTRYRARAEWVAESDVIVAASDGAARQVAALLGYPPERTVVLDGADPGGLETAVEAVERAIEGRVRRSRPAPGPGGRAPGPLPLKVAMVGPMPPHGGGIGVYNHDLLAALAAGPVPLRLDAVMTAPEGWTPGGWRSPPGVGRLHPESLGTDVRPAGYDHLVYTLGNSSGHLVTVEAALRHPGWLWLHETRLPAVATTALDGLGDEEFRDRMAWLLERAYPGRAPVASLAAAGRSHLALARAGVGLTGPLVARCAGVLVNSTAARNFLLLDLPPLAWHPPVRVLPQGCPPLRPGSGGGRGRAGRLAAAFGVVSMSKRPDLLVDAAARGGFDVVFVGPCPPILEELITTRARHLGIEDRVEVTGAVGEARWWWWMERATVAVQLREESSGEISAAVLDALSAGLPVVTNLPSAADYPEGTVAFLPGGPGAPPDPGEVATAVERLLADPARLEGLGEAGRAYAAGHQMADLARALISAITDGG